MDVQSLLLIRGIERLAIAGSAIGLVICGMLLFRWAVSGKSSLVFQARAFVCRLVNAAPGLIVMIFGGVILWTGLMTPISVTITAPQNGTRGIQEVKIAYSMDADQIAQLNTFLTEVAKLPAGDLTSEQVAHLKDHAVAMQKLLKAPIPQSTPSSQ